HASVDPSLLKFGLSLKIGLLSELVVVLVACTSDEVSRLKTKISGLKSALRVVPAKLRVDEKAITFPSSLMTASRLSSATYGATLADPGDGARLAGVLVICANVPVLKSANGISAPVVRSAVSAT